MTWRSWANAEIYDRFVREHPIYAWLNRTLVQMADVAEADRVLDLACGTGATTIACLGRIGPTAEIVGVDASPAMIEVARANVYDPRARFEVAAASDLGRMVAGGFDRVVCNAAFWQFPSPAAVFAAVADRTRPGARFVFNVSAERVDGMSAPIHPFQVVLLREIERELGRPLGTPPARLDPVVTARTANEHGFAVTATERHDYHGQQDELIELMSIPAMILPLTPGLSDAQRERILERSRAKSDPALHVIVPWVFFSLERVGSDRDRIPRRETS